MKLSGGQVILQTKSYIRLGSEQAWFAAANSAVHVLLISAPTCVANRTVVFLITDSRRLMGANKTDTTLNFNTQIYPLVLTLAVCVGFTHSVVSN